MKELREPAGLNPFHSSFHIRVSNSALLMRDARYILQAVRMQTNHDSFIHVLYAIILVQFVAIAVLLGGFSNEYLANIYFRAWINSNYPLLASLLQGQVDALLVGMALGATVLLIQRLRTETKSQHESGSMTGGLPIQVATQSSLGHSDLPAARSNVEMPMDILAELERTDL
jgi:hypothetical protein